MGGKVDVEGGDGWECETRRRGIHYKNHFINSRMGKHPAILIIASGFWWNSI